MQQLTEFEKEQIRRMKLHIKQSRSEMERKDLQNWLNEYVTCLKVHYNKEIDL